MSVVTVTNDFKITLPKEYRRESMVIPGKKFEVLLEGKQLVLVPVVDVRELRGKYKGMATDVPKESDRY